MELPSEILIISVWRVVNSAVRFRAGRILIPSRSATVTIRHLPLPSLCNPGPLILMDDYFEDFLTETGRGAIKRGQCTCIFCSVACINR